jgi:hypothetical protein
MMIFAVQFVSIFVATQAHAQLSPGIQQSGPVQVAPKAQQQQDLKRRLDPRPPGEPVLESVSPADGDILRIPIDQPARVLFRWQTGPGAPVDRHKVCLFEAAKTCEQPGRELYTTSGAAQQFDSFQGLPKTRFMGKSMKWSVAACRDVLILASPGTPQPTTKEICTTSKARQLYWPLSAPRMAGVTQGQSNEPGVPTYTFTWTSIPNARAYLFCLFEGSINSCIDRTTLPNNNPLIVDKGGPSITIDYDLPQFRGKTVRWTVAACTHWRPEQTPSSPLPSDLRCTWQRQPDRVRTVEITNPMVAPSWDASAEIKGRRYSPDNPQPIELRWILNRSQDVKSVKLCVVTAQGPGGTAVAPEERHRVLRGTSPSVCDQRNVIVNPHRPRTLTHCIFRRPLLLTGSSDYTVFGFSAAACNERNECAWTNPLAIIQDDSQPIGGPAICE